MKIDGNKILDQKYEDLNKIYNVLNLAFDIECEKGSTEKARHIIKALEAIDDAQCAILNAIEEEK